MPCRTELIKCNHCDRDVYSPRDNGCKDHAPDCIIAGGTRSSRKLDDVNDDLALISKTKHHDYKGMLCEALKLAKKWCPKGTSFKDAVNKHDPRLIDFMIEHAVEDARKSK